MVTGRDPSITVYLSKTGGLPNQLAIFHNRRDMLSKWVEAIKTNENLLYWYEYSVLDSYTDFVALKLIILDDAKLLPFNFGFDGRRIQLAVTNEIISHFGLSKKTDTTLRYAEDLYFF